MPYIGRIGCTFSRHTSPLTCMATAAACLTARSAACEPSTGTRIFIGAILSCSVLDGEQALQALDVADAHVLLLHVDQAVLLEGGEQPAHRLEFEPQVAAYFLAR